MQMGLLFYILMLFWLLFGFWRDRAQPNPWPLYAGNLLIWILFLLLGWKVFGPPLQ